MAHIRNRPRLAHTLLDFTALVPRQRIDRGALEGYPRGDGGPVLVLPGILHDDRQTRLFRHALAALGYAPFGWELGRNLGPAASLIEGAGSRLARLARDNGPVRLVGFSMGGLFARYLAQSAPARVRQVITVCSPFADPMRSAWLPAGPALALWRGVDIETLCDMVRQTPPVPWHALYSRIDGVVAWQACRDEKNMANCIEVTVRHRQAMQETEVLACVARCLAML